MSYSLRAAGSGFLSTARFRSRRQLNRKDTDVSETRPTTDKTLTPFDGTLVTIRSKKSYAEVTASIETTLQRLDVSKATERIGHQDLRSIEDAVAEVSTASRFIIMWELEQGHFFRLSGIPIESKFYLLGNPVIARDLFRYTAAAGLGAPVRVCVSQRDGEDTRIDLDLPTAFFSKFPELKESQVPAMLDDEMIAMLEDAAA